MRSPLRSLVGPALAFIAVSAIGALFFLDLCDLIYDCGCASWWAGGASHCNIQTPGPPDCPFCAHPTASAAACFLGIGAQAGIILRRFSAGPRVLLRRALLALAAFALVIAAAGGVLGVAVSYWG